jgi:glycerophosphoryl diester phosphodiesterase
MYRRRHNCRAISLTVVATTLTTLSVLAPATAHASTSPNCPLLVAHQGYSGLGWPDGPVPDNSIAALDNAFSHGARTVEFDVRWSKDSVPVVIHNPTLNMTTAHHGTVANMLASKLTSMRLVSPWNSTHKTVWKLPSLAAMIDAARAHSMPVIVEIKTSQVTAQQAATFRQAVAPWKAHVSVHSFYTADLAMFPQYPRTLLTRQAVTNDLGDAGVDMSGDVVTVADVAALHRAGLVAGAFVTTSSGVKDDAAEWERLRVDGIDRIITDSTRDYAAWCAA